MDFNLKKYRRLLKRDCVCTIPSQTGVQALRLTFDSIANANLLVGDASNVSDWNTFFDLPNLGTAFTSVTIVGNEVQLFGGENIKIKPALLYNEQNGYLISIIDEAGCVTSVGGDAFSYNYGLVTVSLPACTIIYGYEDSPQSDYGGFGECINLVNLNLPLLEIAGNYSLSRCNFIIADFPKLITAGDYCFYDSDLITTVNLPFLTTAGNNCFASCNNLTTVNLPVLTNAENNFLSYSTSLTTVNLPSCTNLGGTSSDESVFLGITGNTITLTVPTALMTNNGGNPDGDIQYLQANNTVTIVTV